MTKYHIGENNKPGICTAKDGNCRFSSSKHYNSMEEAEAAANNKNYIENKDKLFTGNKRNKRVNKEGKIYYIDRIKDIKVVNNDDFEVKSKSYHYETERRERRETIEREFGVGKVLHTFEVVEYERRRPSVHQIYDNGKIVISSTNGNMITELEPSPNRIKDLYAAAKVELPDGLIETTEANKKHLIENALGSYAKGKPGYKKHLKYKRRMEREEKEKRGVANYRSMADKNTSSKKGKRGKIPNKYKKNKKRGLPSLDEIDSGRRTLSDLNKSN